MWSNGNKNSITKYQKIVVSRNKLETTRNKKPPKGNSITIRTVLSFLSAVFIYNLTILCDQNKLNNTPTAIKTGAGWILKNQQTSRGAW